MMIRPDELIAPVEQALIGAILVDASQPWPPLSADEFYLEKNRIIWREMQDLRDRGIAVDLVTLSHALASGGKFDAVGGPAYLASCAEAGCSALLTYEYAQQIRDAARSRELRKLGKQLAAQGLTQEEVERALAQLPPPMTVKPFSAEQTWQTIQMHWLLVPLRLHLREVDAIVGGFLPGDLVVVGGRTSLGKTAFLVSAALAWLEHDDASVAVYSLETSRLGMFRRFVAARAKVPMMALRAGTVGPSELAVAEEVAGWLGSRPLAIQDAGSLGSTRAERILEALAVEEAQAVLIDHLQEVITPDVEHRAWALGDFMARLKELAVRREKVLLVAAQVSRQGEQRPARRPILADLKESGGIEERADVVLLLHSPYKAGDAKASPELLQVIIAKNREGGTGIVETRFRLPYGLVEPA